VLVLMTSVAILARIGGHYKGIPALLERNVVL
jgi:hypothetical protein